MSLTVIEEGDEITLVVTSSPPSNVITTQGSTPSNAIITQGHGPQGPSGPQGEQGADGATGPTGPTGSTGPAGATGSQGPAGQDGSDGEDGDTGSTGPAGATGAQGPKGDTGDAGLQGSTGPAGADGADGEIGPQGDPGESGVSNWEDIEDKPTTFPPSTHNHDDRYYTETESNAQHDDLNDAFDLALANEVSDREAADAIVASDAADLVSAEVTARNAAITAAIAGLINSAPGLLDTLDEIAAALGDDPNFAATMTTALTGKQAHHAILDSLAGLASAANKLPYFSGANTLTMSDFTVFARSLLDDADASTARGTLGLGTGAVLDVPTSGDASGTQLVKGSDGRLSDARTPTAHTHPSTDISDSTVTGRSLIVAANAAAVRTAAGLGTAAVLNTGTASGDIPLLGTGGLVASARLGTGGSGAGAKVLTDAATFVTPGASRDIDLLDAVPTSPHAKDSEFTEAALDAKWTTPISPNMPTTVTMTGKGVYIEPSASGTSASGKVGGFGIRMVSPTGAFTVRAKIRPMYHADDAVVGMFVSNGTKQYIVGKQFGFARWQSFQGNYSEAGDWGGYDGAGFETNNAYYNAEWTWVMTTYDPAVSSGTLKTYFSNDGQNWIILSTRTSVTQLTRIGLSFLGANISNNHGLQCAWVRVTEP